MITVTYHHCEDCAYYATTTDRFDMSCSVLAICTRPYRGQPINDLTKFQRNIGDPPGSGGAQCGYCGHHAEYFTPKKDTGHQVTEPVKEPK